MKTRFLGRFLMSAVLVAGAAAAASKDHSNVPATDEQIAKQVTHEILMYPRYSIWDDVNFRVINGQVELTGEVTQPVKKSDLGNIIQGVPGVASVTNDLKVAPLSPMDDRLRMQVARAVYGDATLSRFGMGSHPSIHILVDNGHVTLTGVVNTEMEKEIAGLRAQATGLSFGPVTNNLQVEHPSAKKS
jgi:osmotically-inducible protein OsmY